MFLGAARRTQGAKRPEAGAHQTAERCPSCRVGRRRPFRVARDRASRSRRPPAPASLPPATVPSCARSSRLAFVACTASGSTRLPSLSQSTQSVPIARLYGLPAMPWPRPVPQAASRDQLPSRSASSRPGKACGPSSDSTPLRMRRRGMRHRDNSIGGRCRPLAGDVGIGEVASQGLPHAGRQHGQPRSHDAEARQAALGRNERSRPCSAAGARNQ